MNKLLLLIFIIYVILCVLTLNNTEHYENNLTFTNTDSWGIEEQQTLNNITNLGKKILNDIEDKPYPTGNIKSEIQEIKHLQSQMDNSRQAEIDTELYLEGTFKRFSLSTQDTEKLINLIQTELNPIIMGLKNRYNRVRPYHYDKTIKPSIEPPKHPSYPSGHSTQAYFIALLLSEKYPENKLEYIKIADRIAKNREYAGVHYNSDTVYGKQVAEKIHVFFSNDKNPLL